MNGEAAKQRCPAAGPSELWRAASPCPLPRQLAPPPPTRPRPLPPPPTRPRPPPAGGPQLSPHTRSDPPVWNPGAAPAPGRPTPASLPAGSPQKPAPPTSPGWCPHERSGRRGVRIRARGTKSLTLGGRSRIPGPEVVCRVSLAPTS